jgi:hypothetical protein
VVSGRIAGVESSEALEAQLSGPAPEIVPVSEAPRGADPILTARPVQTRREPGTIGKRTARRRKAEMPVEFTQGALRGTGVTGNVSPRGMFVHSTQIPGTGPTLRLKVNLPEGRTLVLTAKVVRKKGGAAARPRLRRPPGRGLAGVRRSLRETARQAEIEREPPKETGRRGGRAAE